MFIEPQQSGDKKLLQNQFNEKPYPDFNFDEPFDANNFNELFKHSFFLPYIKSFQSFCNTSGARILDVGCGSGHKLLYLAKANPGALITAVDFSSESLEVASQRMKFHGIDGVDFHCVSLDEIPLLGKSFDFINCDEVLYLSGDITASLSVLKSVLNPQGIIRANLHNYYARFYNNCSQELFEFLGLKSEPPGQFRRDVVRLFMNSLVDGGFFKESVFPKEVQITDSFIDTNLILFGDKGFTFPQLFSFLEDSGLSFVDLLDAPQWDLNILFPESKNSGNFFNILEMLEEFDNKDKFHIFELLGFSRRLMDFWCCRNEDINVNIKPSISLADSTIVLNPLLNVDVVKKDIINSCQNFLPFEVSKYITVSSPFPVFIESSQAFLLLVLFDRNVKFIDLVNDFVNRPFVDSSGNYFSSMDFDQSFSLVSKLIYSLESCSFLFILP